jgi:hypothetical protein
MDVSIDGGVLLLNLKLLGSSNILELTESLRNSRSMPEVKHVTLEISSRRRGSQPDWSSDDVRHLFSTIGSLHQLRSARFFFRGHDRDNMIPLSLFTELLRHIPTQSHLETLSFISVGLRLCNGDDIQNFSDALRRQTGLRLFFCSSRFISHALLSRDAGSTNANASSLDPILLALAELPALGAVSLIAEGSSHLRHFQPQSIGSFCQSRTSTLSHLHIANFVLGNEHITVVSNALAGNSAIEDIHIDLSRVTDLDSRTLPASLETNRNLRRLTLHLADHKTLDDWLMNAARALRSNNTLLDFNVKGDNIIKVNEDVEKGYADMLECNSTLERLWLPDVAGWRPKIDLLLEFNRNGRKRFMSQSHSVSRSEWVDLFSENSGNIEFVYYYLRYVSPLTCNAR